MIETVIYANFIPLLSLIFLFIFASINPLLSNKSKRIFLFAIIVNIITIVAVSLDYLNVINTVANYSYAYIIRRIGSFINFAASPVIPFLLLKIFYQKKVSWYFYVPMIVNIVVCFVSIFFQIVFFITENNTYDRGVLFLMPFTIALSYLLFLIFVPMSSQKYSKKSERLCLVGIILLLLASISLEVYLGLNFLMWTSTSLGLVFYYMVLLINRFITDPLTGIYNRNYYSHAISKFHKRSDMIITAIDINGLKKINDKQGHQAGDALLINTTLLILKHTSKYSEFFRIGGDEFMLFTKPRYKKNLEDALNEAFIEAKSKNISFAFGTVYYKANQNLTEVLEKADEEMYKNKKIIKESADYNN